MRLRSLLSIPGLRLTPVCGEDRLDRVIRWVVTTDMRDPSRYLSGGELVLTGLVWRHSPADSEVFVAALARSRVAGLAAWDAMAGEMPGDLVEACERHGVPLFQVPEDLAFATITEQIMRRLSTARAADLTAVLDRHRRLVSGPGLDAVLDLVALDLGMPCWVLTPAGRVVAGPRPGPPDPAGLAAAFLTAPRLPRDHAGHSLFAVDEHGTARVADWFLAFQGPAGDWPEERRALAAELAAVIDLERTRPTPEDRLAADLVRLVATDARPAEIALHLDLTGLSGRAPYTAVAAAATPPLRPADVRAILREALHPQRPVLAFHGDEVVALVGAAVRPEPGAAPAREDGTEAGGGAGGGIGARGGADGGEGVAGRVRRALEALTPGLGASRVTAGVSGAVDAAGLRGAVEEARHARLVAAGRPGAAAVVGHDELGTHMMLLASVPDEVRQMFRARLLGPLLEYDRVHRADLVRTLTAFLDGSGSWTRCAEALHLHVNTLRYRIHRIEELTGRDLTRLQDRVDFFLALRLP
ncbi:PucR family transcriptional regulator [Bailinhaonella thermotolerans]|uniref:PucR family transcriptional regulator n=1 Tax=Bailinhaonella thermotolerans TaxID=1070861 RepID=A0A3A4A6N0_9ACTN|nr:PucR family transcriptional regulator [Bailinhaonella thermotolerans]RJL23581.1 PucR family transcriptional regulator [Bailinhaonella thermotolerans]